MPRPRSLMGWRGSSAKRRMSLQRRVTGSEPLIELAAWVSLIALDIGTGAVWAAIVAPIVMIALGALHSSIHVVPALGFWQVLASLLALRLLVSIRAPEAPNVG